MTTRGRPSNPLRDAARQAGDRYYADQFVCSDCGTNKRYVSNNACVECAVARGIARYAALDEFDKLAHAQRDHARYLTRKSS